VVCHNGFRAAQPVRPPSNLPSPQPANTTDPGPHHGFNIPGGSLSWPLPLEDVRFPEVPSSYNSRTYSGSRCPRHLFRLLAMPEVYLKAPPCSFRGTDSTRDCQDSRWRGYRQSAGFQKSLALVAQVPGTHSQGQVFGDQIIATALLDRLLHHSTIINIKGESYRLKEKRKAGLLTRSEPFTAQPEEAAEP
jgi:hypothetical protein